VGGVIGGAGQPAAVLHVVAKQGEVDVLLLEERVRVCVELARLDRLRSSAPRPPSQVAIRWRTSRSSCLKL
jgi:hypothetical protein